MGESRGQQDEGEGRGRAMLGEPDSLGFRRNLPGFSTNDREASANDLERQDLSNAVELSSRMDSSFVEADARRLPDLGIALKSIAGFWLLYLVLLTLRALVLDFPDFAEMLLRRGAAALFGAFITFIIFLALKPTHLASLRTKATVAAFLCLPASLLFAGFNYFIFYIVTPLGAARHDGKMKDMSSTEMIMKTVVEGALSWYFLFAAWAAFYVAMSYANQLRLSDRRAGALAREAQEAQLRALRYQINPHFLFNTLNSLSSLVLSQKTDVAERMLMNLSTFFRATLSADPTADVPLEEEIKLQRLYLDIEQIRFPSRLAVKVDVPADLLSARVPVLIFQPAVENAVKYGVARSKKPVTISLIAYEEAGRLHLEVRDDGEEAAAGEAGTGVGLRNVCERLTARYGSEAGCQAGPDPEGGFTVHLSLPVIRHG